MSNPSNIRINPFGGIKTYVNLTETHIIPSTSPFVIRLNEVPEKRSPSNIKCVYVNDTTGAATSRALTEVAATPSAGEFRPDYSTKADGNEEWNTGLIEFNSADAGKIVQISYTGMGTLAAVQSNKYPSWYTDPGDGSDGDFIPSKNTTISGVKNYKRVFIKSGITVSIDKYVKIKCQGDFVNKGIITADGKGASGGAGGEGRYSSGVNGEIIGFGASNGGAGGDGANNAFGGAGGAKLNLCTDYSFDNVLCGAGGGGGGGGSSMSNNAGGGGGAGGGDITIIAKSFTNSNKITAKGHNGGNAGGTSTGSGSGGGGGGGGRIMIIANTFTNTGSLNISGGGGGTGLKNGASGGKGILYTKQLGVL